MPHDSHTASSKNQDANRSLQGYADLSKDWADPFPPPRTVVHKGFQVVREDLLTYGSKARFGSCLLQSLPQDDRPLVYVAPRFGFAAISLAALAKMSRRKLLLFMPACKRISDHQAVALELGAKVKFFRIAAMPVLNGYAAQWARMFNARFIPLGLNSPYVTAAIIKTAQAMPEPKEVWTAISTGVLSRGLQLAWPNAEFHAVAVARNIHEGEKGRAIIHSSPQAFSRDAELPPPFPSASNYDAKVWSFMLEHARPGALFWNVAGNLAPKSSKPFSIQSDRPWGCRQDFTAP